MHAAANRRGDDPCDARSPRVSRQIDIAFVTTGHSEYDDDVWRLLRDAPRGFIGSRLSYDHIDYFPLFLCCGASITKALLDCSAYTFVIAVRDKNAFMTSLAGGLPEYIEHLLLGQP